MSILIDLKSARGLYRFRCHDSDHAPPSSKYSRIAAAEVSEIRRNPGTLCLTDRTFEAVEAISEAEVLVERFEERRWCAELRRLHGVFLTAMGADEIQIEASFCTAITIAKEQKSVSLQQRAEATYAEYRRQKASGSGVRGFRLPLW